MALEAIIAHKRAAVARRKAERPLASFRGSLAASDRSLRDAVADRRTGFILECKKASPSRGMIRADFDPAAIARSYAPFCDAVSVLCDESFFQGSLEHLRVVRENIAAPVLCKDFVVDPYQVHEARYYGADAILLMCSVLADQQISACLGACRELGMDALVEVHDEDELKRALPFEDARLIGINNRDLRTLRVDLATTARLAPLVPADRLVICESGIEEHAQVRRLRAQFDGFLVGTSLMRERDLDEAVRRLIFGRVKICGLTSVAGARAARAAGAIFGGLVFWPGSARKLTRESAVTIRAAADLDWVGVFVDAPAEEVARAAHELSLAAVQLHGCEAPAYLASLRSRLPDGCSLWKAARAGDPSAPVPIDPRQVAADRLLIDAHHPDLPGGTGARFDWRLVHEHPQRDQLIVSGGISPANAAEADALDCWALDLSSGVESAPGTKDPERLRALFAALRGNGRVRPERTLAS